MPHVLVPQCSSKESGLTDLQCRQFALAKWCYTHCSEYRTGEERLRAALGFVFEGEEVDATVRERMLAFHDKFNQPKQEKKLKKLLQKHIQRRVRPTF